MIYSFAELPPDQRSLAGGKGGALAQLKQGRYPVPDSFVILPCAPRPLAKTLPKPPLLENLKPCWT